MPNAYRIWIQSIERQPFSGRHISEKRRSAPLSSEMRRPLSDRICESNQLSVNQFDVNQVGAVWSASNWLASLGSGRAAEGAANPADSVGILIENQ